MTSPAVDTMDAGTPDPDESFLADLEANVGSHGDTLFPEAERSSAPESAAPATTDPVVPPIAPEATPSGDPAAATTPDATDIATVGPTPMAYTVNGQQKTLDWALAVGTDGVVIPQDHVAKLQDLVQRDEWQREQNRALYHETQQFQALTYKKPEFDAAGQPTGEREFRGVEAFRQLEAENAKLDASGGAIYHALFDPQFVTNLALAYQSGDQRQVVAVLAPFNQQVRFTGERAEFNTVRNVATSAQQMAEQQQGQQQRVQAFDQTIQQIGSALPALRADDLREMRTFFANFPERIFRPATMAEAQQFGVRPGTIINDPTLMNQWAIQRAAVRADQTAALAAAERAAKENAQRLAPALPAKKTAGKKAPAPTTPGKPAPKFPKDDGSFHAWKNNMMAGRFSESESSDE